MNLIILAAGRGRRLYPLTRDCPKSLLDLGDGTTLLDRQLTQALQTPCITRVSVITGYRYDMLEERLERYRGDLPIETFYNPYFDVSNALMSLWCAHHLMQAADFLVSNGDNIYRDDFLQHLYTATGDGIWLAISHKQHYDEDDMKVRVDAHGDLAEVSKRLAPAAAQADSVGLVAVRGTEHRAAFRDNLLTIVRDPDNLGAFWQESLNGLVARGTRVRLHEVDHDTWAEVDFHPDIEDMRKAVLDNLF